MSRARVTLVAVATLAALAPVGWAFAAPGRQPAAPAAAVAAPGPGRPAPPASRPGSPPGAAARTTPAPAAGPRAAGRAAPLVQPFARQPGVRPLSRRPSPTAPVPVPVQVDGCDHAYGKPTQCVPWTFPPGITDKCAWLRVRGFGPVAVVGRDRQHLDPDGDGIACP
jgi:hypothetical protein